MLSVPVPEPPTVSAPVVDQLEPELETVAIPIEPALLAIMAGPLLRAAPVSTVSAAVPAPELPTRSWVAALKLVPRPEMSRLELAALDWPTLVVGAVTVLALRTVIVEAL